MAWFKIDDTFHSHPKVRRAGAAAVGVWATAGAFSSAYKADGFVPVWWVQGWGKTGTTAARKLVEVGLWDEAEQDGETGYQFHDWADYQPTSEEIERDREAARQRQRRSRERKSRHAAGDHSMCDRCHAKHGNVTPSVTRDKTRDSRRESQHPDPTRPDPTRPVRDGEGEGEESDAGRGAESADPTPPWHTYSPQHHPTQEQLRDGTPAERLHLGWPFNPDKPWLGGHEDNGRIWRTWQMPPWSPHNPDHPQANASTESET